MPLTQPLARHVIEVLGSSVTPPTKGVHYFNVGNDSLLNALDEESSTFDFLTNIVAYLPAVAGLGKQVLVVVADSQHGDMFVIQRDCKLSPILLYHHIRLDNVVDSDGELARGPRLKRGQKIRDGLHIMHRHSEPPGHLREATLQ